MDNEKYNDADPQWQIQAARGHHEGKSEGLKT